MKLYKINLFTSTDIYFRTEEKYFESDGECFNYYIEKYPDCFFKIKTYGV